MHSFKSNPSHTRNIPIARTFSIAPRTQQCYPAQRRVPCHGQDPSSHTYRVSITWQHNGIITTKPVSKPSLVTTMCTAACVHRTHGQRSKSRRGFRVSLCNRISPTGSSSWKSVNSRVLVPPPGNIAPVFGARLYRLEGTFTEWICVRS